MKPFLVGWSRSIGWYLAILVVGLSATLTVSSAVGYLPYSDRPGPGWTEPSFSLEQLAFYLSWTVLLAIPAAIYGSVLFGFQRLLRHLGAPLKLVRVFGGVLGGSLSFYLVAAAGWYIALAAFPAWVAGALGAVWGAALLPRYLGEARAGGHSSTRWAPIGVVIAGGCGVLYLTLFMPQSDQVLDLNVVRMTESVDSEARGWEPQPDEAALLDSLALNGRLDLGLSYYSSSGDRSDTARVLIVFTGSLQTAARLALPEGASVLYVQRGSEWDMFPHDAPLSRRRVKLEVGTEPNEVRVTKPGAGSSVISWTNQQ